MKKVIFLIPTLAKGGGERVVSELSMHLPDSIEKTIVLFNKQISYPYKGKLICLDIPLANPLPLKFFYFFKAWLIFRKVVKVEKPDYVVSFIRPANIINILSGAKAVVRVDSFLSSVPGFIYRILTRIFYNRAFKIICVSEAAAKDLVDSFGVKKEKIAVIHNFLNIQDIQRKGAEPIELKHRHIFEKPVIINTGRIDAGKNQQSLINIFLKVKKNISKVQLVILGTGNLELKLKQLAKDSGMESSIHFLGWQDNPFQFLAKSKVFVSTSLREGLPYGILEAMACGLPVIAADCDSGPKEILAPRTGIGRHVKSIEDAEFGILTPAVTNQRIENEVAQAVVGVLTDDQRQLHFSRQSKRRAEDFDVKNIIKQWEFLYD